MSHFSDQAPRNDSDDGHDEEFLPLDGQCSEFITFILAGGTRIWLFELRNERTGECERHTVRALNRQRAEELAYRAAEWRHVYPPKFSIIRCDRLPARRLWNVYLTGSPDPIPVGGPNGRHLVGHVVACDEEGAESAAWTRYGTESVSGPVAGRFRAIGPQDEFEVIEA